jgi:hypothetical protein
MTWLVTLLERLMARRATRWTPSLGNLGDYEHVICLRPTPKADGRRG